MHGPPEREEGPAFSAALAVGEGVEGRSGVEDDEGDEKCVSIFGVVFVVAGGSKGSGAIVVVGAGSTDMENAHPNALEASSGLAARRRPVSSKIIGR